MVWTLAHLFLSEELGSLNAMQVHPWLHNSGGWSTGMHPSCFFRYSLSPSLGLFLGPFLGGCPNAPYYRLDCNLPFFRTSFPICPLQQHESWYVFWVRALICWWFWHGLLSLKDGSSSFSLSTVLSCLWYTIAMAFSTLMHFFAFKSMKTLSGCLVRDLVKSLFLKPLVNVVLAMVWSKFLTCHVLLKFWQRPLNSLILSLHSLKGVF